MDRSTGDRKPSVKFIPSTETNITDEPRVGYLSQATYLTKSVGYW